MKQETIDNIIKAIQASDYDAKDAKIADSTKFGDIPGMDSMTIINFQMELQSIIGAKAEQVVPVPDMTIGEFAELIDSL